MSKLIDFDFYPIKIAIKNLLKDKTTKKNIIWATNTFEHFGREFDDKGEITERIFQSGFRLMPRVLKSQEAQLDRTRKKAEVFTPAWIVNEMNNYLDEVWFERKNVFNIEEKETWKPVEEKIEFPEKKTWKKYVDSRCLEITCGEGPYLVSRYDVSTGEKIEIKDRIGILDRKLRIVNENTKTKNDWIKWATRAIESSYGFEYQGDNLLIARINIFLTFVEYYEDRWKEEVDKKTLRHISNIISWNIWQMDGLSDMVPFGAVHEDTRQMNFFDLISGETEEEDGEETTYCRIKDWRGNKSNLFKDYKEKVMKKFDFVIGNPPYDEAAEGKDTKNGMKRRKSIFQYFQNAADNISISSVLIYPAVRWIHQGGKGMKQFGFEQINDVHLSKLVYYPKAKDVFKEADLTDGISIVVKNKLKTEKGFKFIYKGEETKVLENAKNPGDNLFVLNPDDSIIAQKFSDFTINNKLRFLFESIGAQKLFGIESSFVEDNPDKVKPLEDVNVINYEKDIKLLTNDKSGSAGRSKWYVTNRDNIPKNKELIDKWKVTVISANPGGQRRDNQLEILDNHSAFGRSKVALKVFDTEEEAKNFYKYMDSKIIRYSLLLTNEALSSVAKYTPDLLNYKSNNKFLDYENCIDLQLKKLFNITNEEFCYISNLIDSKSKVK